MAVGFHWHAGVAANFQGNSLMTLSQLSVCQSAESAFDSLLSIVQMPPGMPVATVGVDRGDNAGLRPANSATSNDSLAATYAEYRTAMTAKVIADDESIQGEVIDEYPGAYR